MTSYFYSSTCCFFIALSAVLLLMVDCSQNDQLRYFAAECVIDPVFYQPHPRALSAREARTLLFEVGLAPAQPHGSLE